VESERGQEKDKNPAQGEAKEARRSTAEKLLANEQARRRRKTRAHAPNRKRLADLSRNMENQIKLGLNSQAWAVQDIETLKTLASSPIQVFSSALLGLAAGAEDRNATANEEGAFNPQSDAAKSEQ